MRNAVAFHRGPERYKHRMRGLAAVHAVQFSTPPIEQPQALSLVSDFVAQIVRPAAEGIDVVEILMQALGKQKADDVEILVVMRRQPASIGAGLFGGRMSGQRPGRLDEIGRG